MSNQHSKLEQTCSFDAVIVGAGFAGMYMLHRLRGMGFSVRVFEAGSGVGGTWYWNRYPGARCDVESMQYSYQFSEELQQEWVWSERYAPQPEILRYANHVADRFELRRDIQFDTPVHSAIFDEAENRWVLEVGNSERVAATHCIMATGCLSSANMPNFAGIAASGAKATTPAIGRGIVTVWTIWLNVGEPGFTSITARASGFEKSGLSSRMQAKFSCGASIASFGDVWKVGSGFIVIGIPPCCYRGAQRPL